MCVLVYIPISIHYVTMQIIQFYMTWFPNNSLPIWNHDFFGTGIGCISWGHFSSLHVLFFWQGSQYLMNILTLSNNISMWYLWDNRLYNLSLPKCLATASDNLPTPVLVWVVDINVSWHSKESTTSTFLSTISLKTVFYKSSTIDLHYLIKMKVEMSDFYNSTNDTILNKNHFVLINTVQWFFFVCTIYHFHYFMNISLHVCEKHFYFLINFLDIVSFLVVI